MFSGRKHLDSIEYVSSPSGFYQSLPTEGGFSWTFSSRLISLQVGAEIRQRPRPQKLQTHVSVCVLRSTHGVG